MLWLNGDAKHSCTQKFNDARLTSSPSRTECVVNENILLSSTTLAEMVFADGLAWYGSFLISAIFVAGAAAVTYIREQNQERLANYATRFEALWNSFLPGFSFGSLGFLLMSMFSSHADAIAAVILLSRIIFYVGGSFLIHFCLFSGSEQSVRAIDRYLSKIIPSINAQARGAGNSMIDLRGLIDESFAKEYVFLIEGMMVFCVFDVTFCQFLLWNKAKTDTFYVQSMGYPCMPLNNFA